MIRHYRNAPDAGRYGTHLKNEQHYIRAKIISVCLSLFIGAALMGVKFYLYRVTHSSAIFSDALESIINVVASGFALISILIAAKIEYFSAGFEGALIVLAAIGIFMTGLPRVFHPGDLPHLQSSLLILFAISLVNLVLGLGLIRVGKRTASLTLEADGKHVLTDVYTSGGVFLGLWLARATGWYRSHLPD
jgi:cation diffusion facilitator family transporter